MRRKITLLLKQNDAEIRGILRNPLVKEAENARGLLPQNLSASCRIALHLAEDPTKQMAHGAEMVDAVPAFDAVFQVEADEKASWDEIMKPVAGIAERLGSRLNAKQSAAIAGTEHIIVPGIYSIMLVMALQKLPSLTSEEFHDYWLNKHAKVALKVPGLQGYRQIHADRDASIEAARTAGVAIDNFEGHVESHYKCIEDFVKVLSQPEVTIDAIEDERKFIDHSRCAFGVYSIDSTISA